MHNIRWIYLDFETYYDSKSYTLRKTSIGSYVRDHRFTPHLLSVAVNNGKIYTFSGNKIKTCLEKLNLSDPNTYVVAHNAKFDIFIITQYYGIEVKNPVCSMALARWCGISRIIASLSQASLSKYLGSSNKSNYLINIDGKQLGDLDADELRLYIEYNKSDIESLRQNTTKMLPLINRDVLDFISLTIRMYSNPSLLVDVELLEGYKQQLLIEQESSMELLQSLFKYNSRDDFLKDIRSPTTFVQMLEAVGGQVPYKISKVASKTAGYPVEKPALAKTDLGFLALLESSNKDVIALVNARLNNNSSMSFSRADSLISKGREGTLPIAMECFNALTGRYTTGSSGADYTSDGINVQNLPRNSDNPLRKSLTAPPNYYIVSADSSQIEARVLASLSGQQDLVDEFINGKDPYCTLAGLIYNDDPEKIYYYTKGAGGKVGKEKELIKKYGLYRFVGKTGILQLGYGSGANGFATYVSQQGVVLNYDEWEHTPLEKKDEGHFLMCKKIVNVYRRTYTNIVSFWKRCDAILMTMINGGSGYFGGVDGNKFYYDSTYKLYGEIVPNILLPDGFRIFYPNLRIQYDPISQRNEKVYDHIRHKEKLSKKIYGGALANNLCQSLAFSILRFQALRIKNKYNIVMNVHDEWSVLVHEDQVKECVGDMANYLRMCPKWAEEIPIDCEVQYGKSYGG